jgi:hypothetical protein
MLRFLLLLAAAALLPACGSRDSLYIQNIGTDTVIVSVSLDEPYDGHDHDVFEVPAGTAAKKRYENGVDLEVLIYRKSDGLILFADDFDREDFEDEHSTIEITVSP